MHDISVGLFRRDLWICRGGEGEYYCYYDSNYCYRLNNFCVIIIRSRFACHSRKTPFVWTIILWVNSFIWLLWCFVFSIPYTLFYMDSHRIKILQEHTYNMTTEDASQLNHQQTYTQEGSDKPPPWPKRSAQKKGMPVWSKTYAAGVACTVLNVHHTAFSQSI